MDVWPFSRFPHFQRKTVINKSDNMRLIKGTTNKGNIFIIIELNNLSNEEKVNTNNAFVMQHKMAKWNSGILPVYSINNSDSIQILSFFPVNGLLSSYLPNFTICPTNTTHTLTPTSKSIIMYGIAKTLMNMHRKKIFFGQLIPINIFLDDKYYPYISNFQNCKENSGNYENDVLNYSMIYTCMFGPIEFSSNKINSNNMFKYLKMGGRPTLKNKSEATKKQKEALQMMWNTEPKSRLKFSEIVSLFEKGDLIFEGTDIIKFYEYQNILSDMNRNSRFSFSSSYEEYIHSDMNKKNDENEEQKEDDDENDNENEDDDELVNEEIIGFKIDDDLELMAEIKKKRLIRKINKS